MQIKAMGKCKIKPRKCEEGKKKRIEEWKDLALVKSNMKGAAEKEES